MKVKILFFLLAISLISIIEFNLVSAATSCTPASCSSPYSNQGVTCSWSGNYYRCTRTCLYQAPSTCNSAVDTTLAESRTITSPVRGTDYTISTARSLSSSYCWRMGMRMDVSGCSWNIFAGSTNIIGHVQNSPTTLGADVISIFKPATSSSGTEYDTSTPYFGDGVTYWGHGSWNSVSNGIGQYPSVGSMNLIIYYERHLITVPSPQYQNQVCDVPYVSSITLGPNPILDNTDATCAVTIRSSSSDTDEIDIDWYKNGGSFKSDYYYCSGSSTTCSHTFTLPYSNFVAGNTIQCRAYGYGTDGGHGDTSSSSTYTVSATNVAPTISSATMSNSIARVGDYINVTVNGITDPNSGSGVFMCCEGSGCTPSYSTYDYLFEDYATPISGASRTTEKGLPITPGEGQRIVRCAAYDYISYSNIVETSYTVFNSLLNITLISPQNYTQSNNTSNNFTANFTAYLGIKNVTLTITNGSNYLCYQETANVSTACGGLNTGRYFINGGFSSIEEMYDGDWSTHGRFQDVGSFFLVNYTKPNRALSSSLWEIKYANVTGDIIENISIPKSCWDYSNSLIFNISINSSSGFITCYNGSWSMLRMWTPTDDTFLYEEAMVWNIGNIINQTTTTYSPGVTSTIIGTVVNLAHGVYNWFYSGFDVDGNSVTSSTNTLYVTLGNISFCQPITIPGSYTMNSSIHSTDESEHFSCIDIRANNVLIDCKGNTIFGSYSLLDRGININGYNNTIIKNCNINDFGDGIRIDSSVNNIFTNITTTDAGNGLNFIHSHNNIINNITLNTNYEGISLEGNNNTLTNIITNSNYFYGIYIIDSVNNTLSSISLNNDEEGIYLATSSNNIIKNGNITAVTNNIDTLGNSKNNIFLNMTYNISKERVESGSYLLKQWYFNGYVHKVDGTPIIDAMTRIWYKTGALVDSKITFGDGLIPQFVLTEYNNTGGTINNYNLYQVNVSNVAAGYVTNSSYLNITGNYYYNITLYATNLPPTSTNILPLNNTITNNKTQVYFSNQTDIDGNLVSAILYIHPLPGLIASKTISGFYNATNWSYNMAGQPDGTYIWQVLVSDAMGLQTYSSNFSITFDTVPPAVNLTYPLNTTYSADITSLNYTSTGASRCWYSKNLGVTNVSNVAAGTNFTGLTAAEGTNTWRVYCNDTAGNINSSTVTFTRRTPDTTPPQVNITYPLNTSYKINVNSINYTASDSIGLSRCWYTRDNGVTNSSTVNPGVNFTSVTSVEGSNTWKVYCNDTSNNLNSSTMTFFKDTVSPAISIAYPLNNYNYTSVTQLNYTSDGNRCWYSDDNGLTNSSSVACGINFTITSSEGSNTFKVYSNDTLGNLNSSSINFFIDSISPELNIVSPTARAYGGHNVSLNYTILDSGAGLSSCWYRNDTDLNNITIACGTNTTIFNIDGTHTIYMWANDTLNNVVSDSVIYSMSTGLPVVTCNYPTNNKFLNSGSNVVFNFTVVEADGVDTCQLWSNINGSWSINQSLTSVTSGIQTLFSPVNINNGVYLWTVWCNDTLNNGAYALNNFTVTIDSIVPIISYTSSTSPNGANVSSTSIIVDVSRTETNFDHYVYRLFNSTNLTELNYTFNTKTWSSIPNGVWYYNVTIWDKAGNYNTTATRTITLDTNAPNITSLTPTNNSASKINSQNLTANITDTNIKNYSLSIYNSSDSLINKTNGNQVASGAIGVVYNFANGIFHWFYSAWDYANNMFTSNTNYITIDNSTPNIIIVSPTSTIYSSLTVNLNVTSSAADINTWWYSLNGANNITFIPNTTINGIAGINNLIVYVNDTINNINSSSVNFNVSSTTQLDVALSYSPDNEFGRNISLIADTLVNNNPVLYCNFTLTNPSGTNVINSVIGSVSVNRWTSTSYVLNQNGTWNYNVVCNNTINIKSVSNSFIVDNYNLVIYPTELYKANRLDKTEVNNFTFDLYDNSLANIIYNITAAIDNSSYFTITKPNSITLDSTDTADAGISFTISVNASSTVPIAIVYNGNITLTNTVTGTNYIIPIHYGILPPSGIPKLYAGSVPCGKLSTDDCAYVESNLQRTTSSIIYYSVFNIGNYSLTDCRLQFSQDLQGADWIILPSSFNLDKGASQVVSVTFSPTSTTDKNTYYDHLSIFCEHADAMGSSNENDADNRPLNKITITDAPTGGDGGGGGGGGGPEPVSRGNTSWKMYTDTRSNIYQLEMSKGNIRTKAIIFENTGTEEVNLTLECEDIIGDLCQYVLLDKTSIYLPVSTGLISQAAFTLNLPNNLGNNTDYTFNIKASQKELDLYNHVGVTVHISSLSIIIDTVNKLSNSLKIDLSWLIPGAKPFYVPYWVIIILVGIIVYSIIYFPLRTHFEMSAIISVISAMIAMLFTIIFLP